MNFDLENFTETFKNKIVYKLNIDTITLDQFIEFIYEELKNVTNNPIVLTSEFREKFIGMIKNNIKSKGGNPSPPPFNIDITEACKELDIIYDPLTETFKLNKIVKI